MNKYDAEGHLIPFSESEDDSHIVTTPRWESLKHDFAMRTHHDQIEHIPATVANPYPVEPNSKDN
jgi:hypothetical protein